MPPTLPAACGALCGRGLLRNDGWLKLSHSSRLCDSQQPSASGNSPDRSLLGAMELPGAAVHCFSGAGTSHAGGELESTNPSPDPKKTPNGLSRTIRALQRETTKDQGK